MSLLRAGCLALLALMLAPALAHKPSDSYLTLQVAEGRVEGRWDIALRDLDVAIEGLEVTATTCAGVDLYRRAG